MDFDDWSLTQHVMAKILSVQKSNICRKISIDGIQAIDQNVSRKRYNISSCRKIFASYFNPLSVNIKNKIQIFYNFKGGTGKTTLCFQVASILSFFGFRVLAVDLDPQGHLSNVLRFNEDANLKTAFDFLINGEPISQCIYNICEGLDAIPGNLGLTRIEVPLSQKTRREETLCRILEKIKTDYDFILIDTNPTISALNINALFAADHINIICETQPFSLNGLCILVEELERIFFDLQKKLKFSIIANKFETKTATAQEVLGILRTDYSMEMTQTVVRKCEDLNLASKKKLPVISFASKDSVGFEDVIDLVKEFIKSSS